MSLVISHQLPSSRPRGPQLVSKLLGRQQQPSPTSRYDYLALDVETANERPASICRIGIVAFDDGLPTIAWEIDVDPREPFRDRNTKIHHIDRDTVRGAPPISRLWGDLHALLDAAIVVSHSPFDKRSLAQTADEHHLTPLSCVWLDSAQVARRTWIRDERGSYGLSSLTRALGIPLDHHNAVHDAKASGMILAQAIQVSGILLDQWPKKVRRGCGTFRNRVELPGVPGERKKKRASRPSSGYSSHVSMDGNPNGPLYGQVLVFTGALSMSRTEAAKIAAQAGCAVDKNVTKRTTLLVVGDQDIQHLAGHTKSSKHRKAEALMQQGQPLRILGESDFLKLVN